MEASVTALKETLISCSQRQRFLKTKPEARSYCKWLNYNTDCISSFQFLVLSYSIGKEWKTDNWGGECEQIPGKLGPWAPRFCLPRLPVLLHLWGGCFPEESVMASFEVLALQETTDFPQDLPILPHCFWLYNQTQVPAAPEGETLSYPWGGVIHSEESDGFVCSYLENGGGMDLKGVGSKNIKLDQAEFLLIKSSLSRESRLKVLGWRTKSGSNSLLG